MADDILVPLIIFGSITAIILMPVYWRAALRRRVLETIQSMAASGSHMSPELIGTVMAPPSRPQLLPSRQRDMRMGYILIAVAVGIVLIGIAGYTIAVAAHMQEAVGVGAGIAALAAIPGCVGVAFLLLGMGQKA